MKKTLRKVQSKYAKRINAGRTGHILLPSLAIQGKQLQEAGFMPGDEVTVTYSDNQVIISKA